MMEKINKWIMNRKFTGKTITLEEHNDIGDKIRFESLECVMGWMTPKPKVGDRVEARGRQDDIHGMLIFQITKMDIVDCSDMFYADVNYVGFVPHGVDSVGGK